MWADGFDDRPARITFVLPAVSDWKIAIQLLPTSDAQSVTAPNLQYLMERPAESSNFVLRTFQVPGISHAAARRKPSESRLTPRQPMRSSTPILGMATILRSVALVKGRECLPCNKPYDY